jgi:tripartite-type tricarboxylate transporter receptor subunit TctC
VAAYHLDRRSLLAATLIGAGLAPADQAAAVAPALRLLLGYGRGSFTARPFSLLEGGLARELGGPVEAIYLVGDQSRRAAATVAAAGPDELILLGTPDFEPVVLPIVYPDVPARPDLRPIAKISRGISLALVVPAASTWRSWSALTGARHQQPLRLAAAGARSTTGLFATILAKLGGFPIEQVTLSGVLAAALEAVDQRVDAAVVTTFDIKPINMITNDALVPLITSGAERSPDFPDIPTISEVTGDRRVDFTTSVSAFASAAMNDALADRLTQALVAAGKAPAAVEAAARMHFPLQIDGPEVVKGTLDRNRRVGLRYREILERTP